MLDHFSYDVSEDGWKEFSERIPDSMRIVFQASGSAYAVKSKHTSLGYPDVTAAHPRELAWIIKSKHKSERVDNVKLTKLYLVGMIPESHFLDEDERIFRDLLIQRTEAGEQVRKLKSSIVPYLKKEDLFSGLPKNEGNFSLKDLVLKTMMDHLEFLQSALISLCRVNNDARLLMTVGGSTIALHHSSHRISKTSTDSRMTTSLHPSSVLFQATGILLPCRVGGP